MPLYFFNGFGATTSTADINALLFVNNAFEWSATGGFANGKCAASTNVAAYIGISTTGVTTKAVGWHIVNANTATADPAFPGHWLAVFYVGSTYIYLWNTTSGIVVNRGATLLGTIGSGTVIDTALHHIEIKVYSHVSDGTVEVKLDGVSVGSLTGLNTDGGNLTNLLFGSSNSATSKLDNIYIADDFQGILTENNNISIDTASVTVSGEAVTVYQTNIISTANIDVTGQPVALRGLEISSAAVVVDGKDLTVLTKQVVPIDKASILVNGKGVWLKTIAPPPEFEVEDLMEFDELGNPHVPCGHWHSEVLEDPVWDFTEQLVLPIPYHKHPTKPEVCGHWHKQGGFFAISIPCIDYVDELALSIEPVTGSNTSTETLLYSGGSLFAVDVNSGTIIKVNPASMEVVVSTTFPDADINSFWQIQIHDGVIWALIKRDGYRGKWIQKITIPVADEAFELIDDPLWAGMVFKLADNSIYGCLTDHTYHPGFFAPLVDYWDPLPLDYGYYTYDYASPPSHLTGASVINFKLLPTDELLFNGGAGSSGSLGFGQYISTFYLTGERSYWYDHNNFLGPEEVVGNVNSTKFATLHAGAAFGQMRLDSIHLSDDSDHLDLVAPLYDADGNIDNTSIYHARTVWEHSNNLIYSAWNQWIATWGRIIAVNPGNGNVVYQYVLDASVQSFVILDDFVYVWSTEYKDPSNSDSIITKLTLELEFVCEENCKGFKNPFGQYVENGKSIVSDGNSYIYNYSVDGITKYYTMPKAERLALSTTGHNPVWNFTKQSNKE